MLPVSELLQFWNKGLVVQNRKAPFQIEITVIKMIEILSQLRPGTKMEQVGSVGWFKNSTGLRFKIANVKSTF